MRAVFGLAITLLVGVVLAGAFALSRVTKAVSSPSQVASTATPCEVSFKEMGRTYRVIFCRDGEEVIYRRGFAEIGQNLSESVSTGEREHLAAGRWLAYNHWLGLEAADELAKEILAATPPDPVNEPVGR